MSLGCPKNLVDSEKMLGLLAEAGWIPVSDPAQAHAIVINTCGFLEAAKVESLGEIEHAAKLKRAGACRRLVVAGCLVQRHRAKLLEWCPDIDALIGVFDRDRIVEAVTGARPQQRDLAVDRPVYSSIAGSAMVAQRDRGLRTEGYFEDDAARLRLTPRHYAYLRISEGCNQHCSFCTIPSIRGKMRSKPPDAVLREARELLDDGAFELNLIGQDTTSYGQDIGYAPGLVGLLESLDRLLADHAGVAGAAGDVRGFRGVRGWLRLMYAYPSCFTDAMIDAIAELPGVVKYIDMPLQHISDPVLERMRRHTSRKLIETLLAKLRKRVGSAPGTAGTPGMAVRTTFITGFPGETEAQHRELVEFVRQQRFEAMGVFAFSPEPGTPAARVHRDGQAVPDQVVRARLDELMRAQQQVAFGRNAALAQRGVEFDVLIDGPAKGGMAHGGHNLEEPAVYSPRLAGGDDTLAGGNTAGERPRRVPAKGVLHVGRTYQQAPQIDGVTYVVSRHKLSPGELVRCRIVDHNGYDLIAQPVEELAKTTRLNVLR